LQGIGFEQCGRGFDGGAGREHVETTITEALNRRFERHRALQDTGQAR